MENVVQQTTDYSQFQSLTNNRNIVKKHVDEIREAIEQNGNLTKVVPILVNESYQIIDGQHRFEACKELGLPIYFTMIPGLGINHARSMNVIQKNWSVDDFARSHADGGNQNYKRYLILKEYGFNHTIILAATQTTVFKKNTGVFKHFKNGDFRVDIEAFEKAHKELGQLVEIGQIIKTSGRKAVATAFLKVMRSDEYDHEKMLKKLTKKAESFVEYSTINDNLRQIEDIYNWMAKAPVRLF